MYKKILVPLDGSELSESILGHVVTIATSCQVPEVVLLTVSESLDKGISELIDARVSMDLEEAYRIASVQDRAYHDELVNYLEKISATLAENGIATKIEVLSGKPSEEIIKYSKDNEVDLIIMSTHGRSGFSRVVFGSVADKVLRQTEVPVLLKPAGHSGIT
jgi:nucleotide-binding universal stress UspA family protein